MNKSELTKTEGDDLTPIEPQTIVEPDELGTQPPGETTPTEPVEPKKPAPVDDLTAFRQKLDAMATEFLKQGTLKPTPQPTPATPTPTEPGTPPPTAIAPLQFAEFGEDIDVGRLNSILKSVVDAVNKQREIKIPTVPDNLVTKDDVGNYVANLQGEVKLLQFFIANQDLLPYSNYVRVKVRQIVAAKPDLEWDDLFIELGKQSRAELRLDEDDSVDLKQPIRRKSKHKTTPEEEADSALQQELDDLDF